MAELRAELAALREELGAMKEKRPSVPPQSAQGERVEANAEQKRQDESPAPTPQLEKRRNPYQHRGWKVLIATVLGEYRFKIARSAKLEGELARRLSNLAEARARVAAAAAEERSAQGLPPLKGLDRLAAIKPGVRPMNSPVEGGADGPPSPAVEGGAEAAPSDKPPPGLALQPVVIETVESNAATDEPPSPRRKTPPRPPSLFERPDAGPNSQLVKSLEVAPPPHTPSPSRKEARGAAEAAREDRLKTAAAMRPPPDSITLPPPKPAFVPPANLPPTVDLGPMPALGSDPPPVAVPRTPPASLPSRAELRAKAEAERAEKQAAAAAAAAAATPAPLAAAPAPVARGFPDHSIPPTSSSLQPSSPAHSSQDSRATTAVAASAPPPRQQAPPPQATGPRWMPLLGQRCGSEVEQKQSRSCETELPPLPQRRQHGSRRVSRRQRRRQRRRSPQRDSLRRCGETAPPSRQAGLPRGKVPAKGSLRR